MVDTILILLAASLGAVALVRRFGLSPIIGFLVVGMALGPHGLELLPQTHGIRQAGELGIVFLMFTIGLEFSLARLMQDRFLVLVLGGLQVVVTAAIITAVAWSTHLGAVAAVTVGVALAMSSTAIVSRLLLEQGKVSSTYGRTAICILLFQDLATILFLMVLPAMNNGGMAVQTAALGGALAKGALVFFILLFVGRLLIRPLFRAVAVLHAPEVFMLAVLTVSVGAAGFAQNMGLSLALGGFMAGMVVGETEFRHQVEADIRPFQDVLLGLFFITVGMLVDLVTLMRLWPAVLALALGLVVLKGAVVLALTRATGNPSTIAIRTAISLAHTGEFGLVILFLAMDRGLLAGDAAQVVLMAVVATMAVAPVLIRYSETLSKYLAGVALRRTRQATAEYVERVAEDLSAHVILCGHGRVGRNIAWFLTEENVEYVALDLNLARVGETTEPGERVSYGDATQRDILLAAGLERAQAVVITYDDPRAALKTLGHVHELRPDATTLVRTTDEEYLDDLLDAGATEVVPDTLETSLTMAAHVLTLLGVPVARVAERSDQIRADRYRLLRGVFKDRKDRHDEDQLRVVAIPEDAWAVGRTLDELALSDRGVAVTAVRRKGVRGADPDPGMRLQADDALIIHGAPGQLSKVERYLTEGEEPGDT